MFSENKVKIYYDHYWTNSEWKPVAKLSPVLKAQFDKYVLGKQTVIDVACGDGKHYGYYLASRVKKYIGIDICEGVLKTARDQGIAPIVYSGWGSLPFADNTFDAVICIELLEHLYDPEEIVEEFHRILKPEGKVIITVPNIIYFRERLLLLRGKFNPGGSSATSFVRPWQDPHIIFFNHKSLKMLFTNKGFLIIELTGDGGNILGDLPGLSKLDKGRVIFPRFAAFWQKIWPSMFASKVVMVAEVIK